MRRLFPSSPFVNVRGTYCKSYILLDDNGGVTFRCSKAYVNCRVSVGSRSKIPRPMHSFITACFPSKIFRTIIRRVPGRGIATNCSF